MPELRSVIPAVVSVNPSDINPTYDTYPTIEIHFSTGMMVSSLNTSLLVNKALTLIEDGTDIITQVSFVEYVTQQNILRVKPISQLTPGVKYNLQIDSRPDSCLSVAGRPLNASRVFAVVVSSNKLNTPSLISPVSSSVQLTAPSFQFSVSTPTAPSGQVVYLEMELSDNGYFNPGNLYQVYAQAVVSGAVVYSFTPSVSYVTETVYWFRSRLYTSSLSSKWSEIYNFKFYSPLPVPSPDSQQIYLPDSNGEFTVTSVSDNGQANLSGFPDLTFYSSFPLALPIYGPSGTVLGWDGPTGSLQAFYEPVDGQRAPLPYTGTWSFISATGVVFTPGLAIQQNTRYSLVFPKGLHSVSNPIQILQDDVLFRFSGPYTPLYAWSTQLRALFGSYVSDISDDLLSYHLYRASLEANRYTLLYPWVSIYPLFIFNSPSLENLQNDNYRMTYSIHMWVIYKAMESLLTMKIYEMAPCSDGRLTFGDYSSQTISSNTLKFLKDMLIDVRKQRAEYELLFSRKAGRPRAPIKASAYPSDIYPFGDYGYGTRRPRF